MLTRRRFRDAALTGAIALALASMSSAQTRPTLSEDEARIDVLEAEVASLEAALGAAEVEVERNRDATCVRADVLGETYRPLVCDPRCDCVRRRQYQPRRRLRRELPARAVRFYGAESRRS